MTKQANNYKTQANKNLMGCNREKNKQTRAILHRPPQFHLTVNAWVSKSMFLYQ